jgi:O-antigen/teichoic acid export membrane protein
MTKYKPLSLRQNFSWTFVSNVIYAGCQWGILMVLAKLGSPEKVGQFTLGLAQTAPVFMLTNLQLHDIQATDARKDFLFNDYLGLRLFGTTIALITIISIAALPKYRWDTYLVILAIALAKAFESISDVFYGLMQQHERMDKVAFSKIIKGFLSIAFLTIPFYLTRSVLWGSIGLCIAWVLVLVGYDLRSGDRILRQNFINTSGYSEAPSLKPRWQPTVMKKLIVLAFPLGLTMMLISLRGNIPRYLIEYYLGERELGIFASLAYLMLLGNMVVNALAQSASPKLSKFYAAGDRNNFKVLLLKLIGIAIVLGGITVVISLIAGKDLLRILYRPEYAQNSDIFNWLMLAGSISYVSWFLGDGLTAIRYLRIQLPLYLLVTGLSTGIGFWLIPIYGLKGAAFALLITAFLEVLLMTIIILHGIRRIEAPTSV